MYELTARGRAFLTALIQDTTEYSNLPYQCGPSLAAQRSRVGPMFSALFASIGTTVTGTKIAGDRALSGDVVVAQLTGTCWHLVNDGTLQAKPKCDPYPNTHNPAPGWTHEGAGP